MGQILYFAFGKDLPHERVKAWCPGADWLGVAKVEGHRLGFDANGEARLEPEMGEIVWGALWLLPSTSLPELDRAEGATDGRTERTTARIVSPAGPRAEAMVYVGKADGAGRPGPDGLKELLAGAKESRLPDAYVKALKGRWS